MPVFNKREKLICRILSHLTWDKKTKEFNDNWFNDLIWNYACIVGTILKVDIMGLVEQVVEYVDKQISCQNT